MRTATILSLALFLAGCSSAPSAPSVDYGTLTIAELREKLSDPDRDVRWSAVLELGCRDAEAAPAIPDLTRRLKDEDAGVRQVTTQTLGSFLMYVDPPFDEDVQTAIAALRAAQSDPDEKVRFGAGLAVSLADTKLGRRAAP